MTRYTYSPAALLRGVISQHALIRQMISREIAARYQGTFLGLAWALITPLLLLGIYTFVFSGIFKARWLGSSNHLDFALALFAGMILHAFFAECLNRAPSLILNNANYVKKVVFPLDTLPWTSLGSALAQLFVSYLVLLAAIMIVQGGLPLTSLLFPLIVLPLALVTLGISWLLAATSVFLRDLGQITGFLSTALLFLSPIFYPLSALPENLQPLALANPLTFIIEQSRRVILQGQMPDLQGWAIYMAVSLLIAWLGYAWFQRLRNGFADVI
jgi:lipopolysaccharide transport system permease protein